MLKVTSFHFAQFCLLDIKTQLNLVWTGYLCTINFYNFSFKRYRFSAFLFLFKMLIYMM